MIVVTVFLSNLNQMEIHLVQNRKENCHHDHIPFNLKRNGILVFSVWGNSTTIRCTAVREMVFFGIMESLLKSSETMQRSRHYGIKRLKWDPQFIPHYAERHMSLSDSRCKCFQLHTELLYRELKSIFSHCSLCKLANFSCVLRIEKFYL